MLSFENILKRVVGLACIFAVTSSLCAQSTPPPQSGEPGVASLGGLFTAPTRDAFEQINLPASEGKGEIVGSVLPDGRTIFLASNRIVDSLGGYDICMSSRPARTRPGGWSSTCPS